MPATSVLDATLWIDATSGQYFEVVFCSEGCSMGSGASKRVVILTLFKRWYKKYESRLAVDC